MYDILIFGGTRFVSRYLAERLIEKGNNVDILTRGNISVPYNGMRNHLICDRKNKGVLNDILKDKYYDFVFDICAYTQEDMKYALAAVEKEKLKKYIFCSTASVYLCDTEEIDENSTRVPLDFSETYGRNKRMAEDELINSGVPYAIVRPTYIYGEYNEIPREGYIFDCILKDKVLYVPKVDNVKLTMIYVEELIEIFISAMDSLNKAGIYNGNNEEVLTIEELIECIEIALGKKALIQYYDIEKDKPKKEFPYAPESLIIKNDNLRKDGMYVPKIPYKMGIAKTYKWYTETIK